MIKILKIGWKTMKNSRFWGIISVSGSEKVISVLLEGIAGGDYDGRTE